MQSASIRQPIAHTQSILDASKRLQSSRPSERQSLNAFNLNKQGAESRPLRIETSQKTGYSQSPFGSRRVQGLTQETASQNLSADPNGVSIPPRPLRSREPSEPAWKYCADFKSRSRSHGPSHEDLAKTPTAGKTDEDLCDFLRILQNKVQIILIGVNSARGGPAFSSTGHLSNF
jgi:hypothetical protein